MSSCWRSSREGLRARARAPRRAATRVGSGADPKAPVPHGRGAGLQRERRQRQRVRARAATRMSSPWRRRWRRPASAAFESGCGQPVDERLELRQPQRLRLSAGSGDETAEQTQAQLLRRGRPDVRRSKLAEGAGRADRGARLCCRGVTPASSAALRPLQPPRAERDLVVGEAEPGERAPRALRRRTRSKRSALVARVLDPRDAARLSQRCAQPRAGDTEQRTQQHAAPRR